MNMDNVCAVADRVTTTNKLCLYRVVNQSCHETFALLVTHAVAMETIAGMMPKACSR